MSSKVSISKVLPNTGSQCGTGSGWRVDAGETSITICSALGGGYETGPQVPPAPQGPPLPHVPQGPPARSSLNPIYSWSKGWKLPTIKFPDLHFPPLQFPNILGPSPGPSNLASPEPYYEKVRSYMAGEPTGGTVMDRWKWVGMCLDGAKDQPWFADVSAAYKKIATMPMDDASFAQAYTAIKTVRPADSTAIDTYFTQCVAKQQTTPPPPPK
jgi:hypothetical protein